MLLYFLHNNSSITNNIMPPLDSTFSHRTYLKNILLTHIVVIIQSSTTHNDSIFSRRVHVIIEDRDNTVDRCMSTKRWA